MASPGIEVIRPLFVLVLALVCLDVGRVAAEEIGYSDWKDRCLKTPSNRTLRGRFPSKDQLPLKDFRAVQQVVEKLFVQI